MLNTAETKDTFYLTIHVTEMNGGVRNDPTLYLLQLTILGDVFVTVSEALQVRPAGRQELIGADLARQGLPFTHVRVFSVSPLLKRPCSQAQSILNLIPDGVDEIARLT
jgi:hypothetical protein